MKRKADDRSRELKSRAADHSECDNASCSRLRAAAWKVKIDGETTAEHRQNPRVRRGARADRMTFVAGQGHAPGRLEPMPVFERERR
jgi:hypothetical protein